MVRPATSPPASPALRPRHPGPSRRSGAMTTDLVVAIAILTLVLIPMAFAFHQEMRLCRSYYCEAVAMELVDGEMEILAAGEWRAFQPGIQSYPVKAEAATNLPPGRFVLSITNQTVRLEWRPARKGCGRPIVREARVP